LTFHPACANVSLMKQRSTTPVSKGLVARSLLVTMTILMVLTVPLTASPRVSADQFDDQIKALQREIDAYEAKARNLQTHADSLQVQLNVLTSEKRQIQAQISLNQAKSNKLKQQIKATEQTIKDNKEALGQTLASLYIEDKISPLEMLASSKNIGDYVDKQEYRSSIREQLSKTIDKIQTLKASLVQQKVAVERVLGDQTNARNALSAKEAQQQGLLTATRGEENAYQQLSAESNAKKLEVQKQQQAAIEEAMRQANGGGPVNILPGDPNKGGYPWEQGCTVDGNAVSHGGANGNGGDPLGYGCRQCTSYAAWKIIQKTGYEPMYWGNANMWPGSAQAAGFTTGNTPRVGSVGIISAGQYGHVVFVEAVNDNGTVDVSQYNYYNAGGSGWGHYSKMRVSSSTYDTYIYL
jgi:surface antigen/peptidoglycan hydrolase CwlO-like protein